MGVFRTKFVTENVEQHREKGEREKEREGEAQNTTLHAKFSKKHRCFARECIDSREPNFYERRSKH